jgi:hypothetical protein
VNFSELVKQILSLIPGTMPNDIVQFVQSHFGTAGLAATFVLGLIIGTLIVIKVLKIAFDILRFVAIPSLVVTFIASVFLPYPFAAILPVVVVLFSVVLIIRA